MGWEDKHELARTSRLGLGEGGQCILADSNLKLIWRYQIRLWASHDREGCNVTEIQIKCLLNISLQCDSHTAMIMTGSSKSIVIPWGTNLLQVQQSGTATSEVQSSNMSHRKNMELGQHLKQTLYLTDWKNRNWTWGHVQWKTDTAVTSSHFEEADFP